MIRAFVVFAVFTALIIYSSGLWAPFHLDDPNVLQLAQTPGAKTRPLGFASFGLSYQVLQIVSPILPWTEPFYHRLVNVFIHVLAATGVFWLVRELTGKTITASLAGALFLVHPIQTQAVTYITQRFESQAAMFMIFSAAAYVRFRRTGFRWWMAAAIASGIAAGLTKETALVLPVWIILIETTFLGGWAQLRKQTVYLLPLLLIFVIPLWRGLPGALSGPTLTWIPWPQYWLTQGPILAKYFELSTWPRRQFLFYDYQAVEAVTGLVVLQWVLVLFVIGLGVFCLKRQKTIGFGILTFFILLLPIIVLPLPDLINEHRLYPAFAGVAIAAAGVLEKRRSLLAVAALLIVLLGWKTSIRNSEWSDQIQFLESHRRAFPRDPAVLTRLASYYYMGGQVNKALELNLEARKHEDRYNSYYRQQGHLLTSLNLTSIYMVKGNTEAGKIEALRAVAAKPKEPLAWHTLGRVQLELKDYAAAQKSFEKLVELDPDPEAWRFLQFAASRAGDEETAKRAGEKAKSGSGSTTAPAVQKPPFTIPKEYAVYAIFVLTAVLLGGAALAVWAVWSSLRAWRDNSGTVA